MRLPNATIDWVVDSLQREGLLPLPGGHGVRVGVPAEACIPYRRMFPIKLRSASLIWMLADAGLRRPGFRSACKDWLDDAATLAAAGAPSAAEPAAHLAWDSWLYVLEVHHQLLALCYQTNKSGAERLRRLYLGAVASLKPFVIEAVAEATRPLAPGEMTLDGYAGAMLDPALLDSTAELLHTLPAVPHSGLTGHAVIDALRLAGADQDPGRTAVDARIWGEHNLASLRALDHWLAMRGERLRDMPRPARCCYALAAIAMAARRAGERDADQLFRLAIARLLRRVPGYIVETDISTPLQGAKLVAIRRHLTRYPLAMPTVPHVNPNPPEVIASAPKHVQYADDAFDYFRINTFDRWLAKAWRDATLTWFAIRGVDSADKRALCNSMLDAVALISAIPTSTPGARAGQAEADPVKLARKRIDDLSMDGKPLPAAMGQPAGHMPYAATLAQLQAVDRALRDRRSSAMLRARLLLRLVHAELAIVPPCKLPDSSAQDGLYKGLLRVLSKCAAPPVRDCQLRLVVDDDLRDAVAQVLASEELWSATDSDLPGCFNIHDTSPLPLMRELCMRVERESAPGLAAVDMAARLLVDVLTDPMHAGHAEVFRSKQYRYIGGAIRSSGQRGQRGPLADANRAFFEHLEAEPCSTRIQVQRCLTEKNWHAAPGPDCCPLCQRRAR